MTTRQIQTIIFIFVLAAGIGLAFLLLPGQTQAQGGGVGAQAAVGTAFTYQGRLVYNGSAVSGTCDLTFNLYNVDSGSTPVGSVNKPSVSVSDGYFSVDLDFGASAFTGEARWLEVVINSCPGGASGVTLSPRVALNPAPYALSLRPGAVISGSVGGSSGNSVLNAINSATSGATYGVYGQTNSSGSNASGVYGYAGAGTGSTNGVWGHSASTSGTGVYGLASASTGYATGVFGGSTSTSGTGVYGYASASSGQPYGVYGRSNSPTGYGVYSTGNAHVEGQLTWKPITSYLSIPAAAFNPTADGRNFDQQGNSLSPAGPSPMSTAYVAPVQLPHGATVTKFTFYWADGSSSNNGSATLYRIDLQGNEAGMASASTTGNSGTPSSSTVTSISLSNIDNSQYGYYVWLILLDTNIHAYGVVIEYTIDRPY